MSFFSKAMACAFIVAAAGCSNAPSAQTVSQPTPQLTEPYHWVEVNGNRFKVEVAATQDEQSRGLQNRSSLPKGQGMWFTFESPLPLGFWMKDTHIPLDILFFDQGGVLLNIHDQAQPCTRMISVACPTYKSNGPAQYVLEINGGEAAALGLKPGQTATWGSSP